MNQLEIFFDYTCPYCRRAHDFLVPLLEAHPDIQPLWRPCEAHPRPEVYGRYSDLCVAGMFFARDAGVDLLAFHARMFHAVFQQKVDVEDPAALAQALAGLVDPAAFRQALEARRYWQEVLAANDYAYEQNAVWAVPAYRLNGKKLDAVEGSGVAREDLAAFLQSAKGSGILRDRVE
jgi:predicted DsbA family dithiol-disulfide isomerase